MRRQHPSQHPPILQLPCLLELNLGWNIRLRDESLEALPPSITKLDLRWGHALPACLPACLRRPASSMPSACQPA